MADEGEIQWESRYVGGSRFADGSAIIRPTEVPWTDGPLEGLQFRLTHADPVASMWTALYHTAPGSSVPAHYIYGEVQFYVTEGSVTIGDIVLNKGDYYQFTGGLLGASTSGPSGSTFFVMYNAGGLSEVDADGEPAGPFIDARRIFKIARANGAAAHLESVVKA
jgi:hypothetical protein